MLTARKVLSYSFAISAASGEETRCSRWAMWRSSSEACAKQVSVDGAHHPRVDQLLVLGHAGVDALGRVRDEHVLAGAQAALGQRLDEQITRAPHARARRQHERLARTPRPATTDAHVRVSVSVLGRPCRSTVVGTLMSTRSAAWTASIPSVSTKSSSPILRRAAPHADHARELPGAPAADVAQAAGGRVDADDPEARATQRQRARQAGRSRGLRPRRGAWPASAPRVTRSSPAGASNSGWDRASALRLTRSSTAVPTNCDVIVHPL